jgi:hypothetical protein
LSSAKWSVVAGGRPSARWRKAAISPREIGLLVQNSSGAQPAVMPASYIQAMCGA